MQDLTAWLNSDRDFAKGVEVYLKYGDNKQFVQLLLDGETQYTRTNLFDNLRKIYYDLKNGNTQTDPVVQKQHMESKVPEVTHADQSERTVQTEPQKVESGSLAEASKMQADKLYKELMNLRAQLFSLCDANSDSNDNDVNLINQRESIVIQMMDLQSQTDQAYEKLRYVQEHGSLPNANEDKPDEIPTNPIQLMNFRKNLISGINKLKKKEQTPERIALLSHKQTQLAKVDEQISNLLEK